MPVPSLVQVAEWLDATAIEDGAVDPHRVRADLMAGDWFALGDLLPCSRKLPVFIQVRDLVDDETYWRAFRDAVLDCENLWRFDAEIRDALASGRGMRETLMDEEELARRRRLPQAVRVWRAAQRGLNERGWSWSLRRAHAQLFLRGTRTHEDLEPPNLLSTPVLLCGCVDRSDVVAVFLEKDESEVFAPPEAVRVIREIPLPSHRRGAPDAR